METKDHHEQFLQWIKIKETLYSVGRVTGISEGQIWWAAIGENIGIEINGKSAKFSRPVLVYKKLSKYGFMAIPLTTQDHTNNPWYVPYEFHGKICYAALAQARVLSVSRLYGDRNIGEMSEKDLNAIQNGFQRLYFLKKK